MAACYKGLQVRNPFAIDLFNYIWNKFRFVKGYLPNTAESYFTEDIGDAVVCLIVMARRRLYQVLCSLYIRSEEDAINVARKLCKTRRRYRETTSPDNCQVFLELCAIIAEVHLFCCAAKEYTYFNIAFTTWNFVMNGRFMHKMLSEDGWAAVNAHARLYRDTKDVVYNACFPPDSSYVEYSIIQSIEEEFMHVDASFWETFKYWHLSDTSFNEGAHIINQQDKIRRLISRLEIRASEERGDSSSTRIEYQIATQRRKLQRSIESTEWSQAKIAECMKPISPYITSDDDEEEEYDPDEVMGWCTRTSDDIHVPSSGSQKKKKQKKKKKKPADQESRQSSVEQKPGCNKASQDLKSTARPLRFPIAPTATAPVSTATAPVSTATAPVSTATAPVSTATAPVSTATAPVSTATAPVSTATAPVSTATTSLSSKKNRKRK